MPYVVILTNQGADAIASVTFTSSILDFTLADCTPSNMTLGASPGTLVCTVDYVVTPADVTVGHLPAVTVTATANGIDLGTETAGTSTPVLGMQLAVVPDINSVTNKVAGGCIWR